MGLTVDLDRDWRVIVAALPANWRTLATEQGLCFEPRPHLKTKIHDPGILLRLILHHACTSASLKTSTALAAALGLVAISPVALHKWMTKAGPWLSAMLAADVAADARFAPERWAGYELVVADATCVQRPGATGTTARVHYALRLADLRPHALVITSEKVGETLRNFVLSAGQLWLLDRGYANPPGLAHAAAAAAAVLVRYNFGSLPLYDVHGRPFDVRAAVARLGRPGHVREWAAWVHPEGTARIAGRLVAVRLPAAEAAKARDRVRRELGKDATADALRLAEFVVLFTTVPRATMHADVIVMLYRDRWQVELKIKRDKSIGGLDRLPNFRDDTIAAWIAAKLLGQHLAQRLAEPGEPFPPSVVGAFALHAAGFARGAPDPPRARGLADDGALDPGILRGAPAGPVGAPPRRARRVRAASREVQ